MTFLFTSWSFSRYSDYHMCPAKAKYKYLEKVRTDEMIQRENDERSGKLPENPLARGERVAKVTENYLKKKTRTLPSDIAALGREYKALREKQLTVEDSWGFDKDWRPCGVTDWNRCWLRVKIDINYIESIQRKDWLRIIDNKTGRYRLEKYEEYQEQLHLYGVAGLARMPTVVGVSAQLYYSDEGIVYPKDGPVVFERRELEMMKKVWEKKLKPFFNDRKFTPKPGYYCQWCDYSKKKGGPCKY